MLFLLHPVNNLSKTMESLKDFLVLQAQMNEPKYYDQRYIARIEATVM